MSEEIVWIASFDIGKKNFSFYIEEFDVLPLNELCLGSPKERYRKDGTPCENFVPILDDICGGGKKILLENHDLTKNCKGGSYLDPLTFYNMNNLLDEYRDYWEQCDLFVIEKQMSFRGIYNTMALKLGQHCWSYFCINYGTGSNVVEFPAYYKTQILGIPKICKINKSKKISYKSVSKPVRKKWCIDRGIEIIGRRGDEDTLNDIKKSKKKDDLCDVICQLQAFKILKYVDKIY